MLLIQCLTLLAVFLGVHPQTEFTEGRFFIGNCLRPNASTISNLISGSFDLDFEGAEAPEVTLLNSTIVCEAPGLFRGTISSFSVVALYSCISRSFGCDGTPRTEQFQFDCNEDDTFTRSIASLGEARTTNPTATLQTPLNEDCAQCSGENLVVPTGSDHCVCEYPPHTVASWVSVLEGKFIRNSG